MTAKIKICGLMRKEDAEILNENKVDYAGFVLFFPKSKRCLELSKAEEIMDALQPSIKKVAVTVTPSLEEVMQIEAAGFDVLQVHGELKKEVLEKTKLPILRAVNISGKEDLAELEQSDKIIGYVLDGKNPGGGKAFDWDVMKEETRLLFYENGKRTEKLFMLAGGLYPENVGEALRVLLPDIVDVSSGVELDGTDEQGKSCGKDKEKVERFCRRVRKLAQD